MCTLDYFPNRILGSLNCDLENGTHSCFGIRLILYLFISLSIAIGLFNFHYQVACLFVFTQQRLFAPLFIIT